ncbi:MAG TPA: response regulator transcription factor [Candidatus Dormibacteraeota bacterium]
MNGDAADVRVLLVEDHRMVAEAIASALNERAGIRVVGTAGSMAEACGGLRGVDADVVLVDYRLPDATGTVVARELMAQRPEVRVVIITAAEDEAILTEALDAGCCGCVRKSAGIEELVSAVQAARAGKVVIPAVLLERVMNHLRQPADSILYGLTPRELDVLRLLAGGWTTRAMADELGVTFHTIRNYVQAVIQKLGAHSRLEAVAIALREGVVASPER